MPNFFNMKTLFPYFSGVLIAVFFLTTPAQAQLRYGFKTGLNFASINGPSEMDSGGSELESWSSITGFHIGLSLGYAFNDYLGVRSEFLYSKKGAKYTFDGPSYRIFRLDGVSTLTTGNSRYRININNAYLDIPLVAYGRWKDFELSAGMYASLLVQSIGDGSLNYTNGRTAVLQNPVADVELFLDYNYRKDEPGRGIEGQTEVVQVDAKTVELPKTLGAYYDFTEDKGNLYNTLDYGLVAGLSYFMSRSLFIGVRLQYGLADLTRNAADLSKGSTDNGNLLFRDDKDRNVVIQASVGFSF